VGNSSPVSYKPYYEQLTAIVSAFSTQIHSEREEGKDTPPPVTEWVLLKAIKRKWSEPRWTGPYKVVETVRLQGKGETWFHWSRCTPAEPPGRSRENIRQSLKDTQQADPEETKD